MAPGAIKEGDIPMPGKHDEDVLPVEVRLEQAFAQVCSNLYGAMRGSSRGCVYAVYAKQKVGGVWLATAKRYDPVSGEPMVAFGNGASFLGALTDLSKSLSGSKWKPDKPWGV